MGTVTQYNLAHVRNALGGSNPVSMSQYYRGGARVPATRTVNYTAREPGSGELYSRPAGSYWGTSGIYLTLYFQGTFIGNFTFANAYSTTVYTVSGITYYRGTLFAAETGKGQSGYYYYGIYRTYPASYQQAINTGVPSSGSISMSQLYGAENP